MMGFNLCVLWQIVSSINLKMKTILAFEKRYLRRDSSVVISMPWFALSLSRIFSFLCLPEWKSTMSAAILFWVNDWLNPIIHLLDVD